MALTQSAEQVSARNRTLTQSAEQLGAQNRALTLGAEQLRQDVERALRELGAAQEGARALGEKCADLQNEKKLYQQEIQNLKARLSQVRFEQQPPPQTPEKAPRSPKNDQTSINKQLESTQKELYATIERCEQQGQEVQELQSLLEYERSRNESLTQQLGFLNRKYESIVLMKQSSLTKSPEASRVGSLLDIDRQPGSETRLPQSPQLGATVSNTIDTDKLQSASITELTEYVRQLHRIIQQLEDKTDRLRKELNQQLAANSEKPKRSGGFIAGFLGSNEQESVLQKLANSLSETVEEKSLALDNQKKINKQLMQRVQQLDAELKAQRQASEDTTSTAQR